jgi:hypothetical protein
MYVYKVNSVQFNVKIGFFIKMKFKIFVSATPNLPLPVSPPPFDNI